MFVKIAWSPSKILEKMQYLFGYTKNNLNLDNPIFLLWIILTSHQKTTKSPILSY